MTKGLRLIVTRAVPAADRGWALAPRNGRGRRILNACPIDSIPATSAPRWRHAPGDAPKDPSILAGQRLTSNAADGANIARQVPIAGLSPWLAARILSPIS